MRQVFVSCEHASPAVPRALRGLGLPDALLRSHVGWDPGAAVVARALARTLRSPLLLGRWSRLVADLNRSCSHPRCIAPAVGARSITANAELTPAARAARLRRYWAPYRDAAAAAVAAAVAAGSCLHLSVHSFVERLGGVERRNDVGILFDPRRLRERAFAVALQRELRDRGFSARKNFPYFGHTDGLTTAMRAVQPRQRYLGIEIELNQRLARTAAGQRRLAAALCASVLAVLGRD